MQNISTAWLTTNYTCNCKCDWCYAQKMLAKHRCMDLQYAKQIVSYLHDKKIQTVYQKMSGFFLLKCDIVYIKALS